MDRQIQFECHYPHRNYLQPSISEFLTMAKAVTQVSNRLTRIYNDIYFTFFLTHIPVMFCRLISSLRCRLHHQTVVYFQLRTRKLIDLLRIPLSRKASVGLTYNS